MRLANSLPPELQHHIHEFRPVHPCASMVRDFFKRIGYTGPGNGCGEEEEDLPQVAGMDPAARAMLLALASGLHRIIGRDCPEPCAFHGRFHRQSSTRRRLQQPC